MVRLARKNGLFAVFSVVFAAFILFGCINGGGSATPTPEATPLVTPEATGTPVATPTPSSSLEKCEANAGFDCDSFSVQAGGNLALAIKNLNQSTVRITGAACATTGTPQAQPLGMPMVILPGQSRAVYGTANSCCGAVSTGDVCEVDVTLTFTVDGEPGSKTAYVHLESVVR